MGRAMPLLRHMLSWRAQEIFTFNNNDNNNINNGSSCNNNNNNNNNNLAFLCASANEFSASSFT
jgi:hypothetical protein